MSAVLGVVAQAPHDCVAVTVDASRPGEQALSRAADLLYRTPGVGTVFIARGADAGAATLPGRRWLRLVARQGSDVLSSGCAVTRRSVFEAVGQPVPATMSGALSLWLRAAALADVGRVTASPWGAGPDRVGDLTTLHELAHAFRRLFDDFAPVRDDRRLRSTIYRALARSARSRARVAAYDGDAVEASLCLHLAGDIDRWRRVH